MKLCKLVIDVICCVQISVFNLNFVYYWKQYFKEFNILILNIILNECELFRSNFKHKPRKSKTHELHEDGQELRPKLVGVIVNKNMFHQVCIKYYV
jgi:hypothetical protein